MTRMNTGGMKSITRVCTIDESGGMASINKNGSGPDVEHFQVTPTERPILKQLFKRKKRGKRKKK